MHRLARGRHRHADLVDDAGAHELGREPGAALADDAIETARAERVDDVRRMQPCVTVRGLPPIVRPWRPGNDDRLGRGVADRRFHPADATYAEVGKDERGQPRFDQRQLVLRSPLVPAPQHFRYAWGRSPLGNLQATGNKDLPFPSQRSDDWDMGEVPLGVLGDDWNPQVPLTGAQRNRVLQELRKEDLRRRIAEAEAVLRTHADGSDARPAGRR